MNTAIAQPGTRNSSVLTVKNLSFSYREHTILDNVCFSVGEGEICGLLGPNGSGKTTLLKCINRILPVPHGTVFMGEEDSAALSRRDIAQRIAAVPQEMTVYFPFTVLQMVLMGGNARFGYSGIPSKTDERAAADVLESLSIEYLSHRIYNELSGGEKQMTLIARAIFQNAGILLLDEPTSHLDFKRQFQIMELISSISKERKLTVIVTLHDPNTAGKYCSHLVMLGGGKIIHQGEREHVFSRQTIESTYDMNIRIEYTDRGSRVVLPETAV